MATHSGTLAWKIPWTEEPGGLQSVGSHRVTHDGSDIAAAAAAGWAVFWKLPGDWRCVEIGISVGSFVSLKR